MKITPLGSPAVYEAGAYALSQTSQYGLSLKQSIKYYASKLFPEKFKADGIPYHNYSGTSCRYKVTDKKTVKTNCQQVY